MRTFLSPAEAAEAVLAEVPPLETEEVPLRDALGAVLAGDVLSDIDMPPWNKSAVDGYAVVVEDLERPPVELEVVEEIPAGTMPTRPIRRGECSKVMTGAPVPQGSDAVVMVEETETFGKTRVRIHRAVRPGANICVRGEDLRRGQRVLAAGTRLRPQEMAILASVGAARVRIYRRPRLAVIATGDELVPVEEVPTGGKIRNSNTYNIAAQARQMGLTCDDLGIARDNLEDLRARIRQGLERDVLILSGGVSAGDHDLVIDALKQEGVEGLLHQVMVKPGRPFFFGRRGRRRVFALPGNPVSTFVLFEVYVRLFLGRMMGVRAAGRPIVQARLTAPIGKPSDRMQFLAARLRPGEGGLWVEPLAWHGSADIFALAAADALLIVPANSDRLPQGAQLDVMVLDPRNE